MTNLITFPSHRMVAAYVPCQVIYQRGRGGGRNDPHLWNRWP